VIELRWVEHFRPTVSEEIGVMEKTLQIRYDISHTQGIWYTNPEDRMSPWQDVPTVKEES